jgi:hypothetical protein
MADRKYEPAEILPATARLSTRRDDVARWHRGTRCEHPDTRQGHLLKPVMRRIQTCYRENNCQFTVLISAMLGEFSSYIERNVADDIIDVVCAIHKVLHNRGPDNLDRQYRALTPHIHELLLPLRHAQSHMLDQ